MPITRRRLTEIAAIADEDIDTSEIPQADEAWFGSAKLLIGQGDGSAPKPVDDRETRRSAGSVLASTARPRPMR